MDVCIVFFYCFLFKQKTAYVLRISGWSSDVCSSDLLALHPEQERPEQAVEAGGVRQFPYHPSGMIGGFGKDEGGFAQASHLELKFATIQSRHPELVSGSIVPQAMTPNGEEIGRAHV